RGARRDIEDAPTGLGLAAADMQAHRFGHGGWAWLRRHGRPGTATRSEAAASIVKDDYQALSAAPGPGRRRGGRISDPARAAVLRHGATRAGDQPIARPRRGRIGRSGA